MVFRFLRFLLYRNLPAQLDQAKVFPFEASAIPRLIKFETFIEKEWRGPIRYSKTALNDNENESEIEYVKIDLGPPFD